MEAAIKEKNINQYETPSPWNSYEKSVAGLLHHDGIEMSRFSASDIIELASIPSSYFYFFNFDTAHKVFAPFDNKKIVEIFVYFYNHLRMDFMNLLDDDEIFDRPEEDDFNLWIWTKANLESKRKYFSELLKNVNKHPDTPIELLAELL